MKLGANKGVGLVLVSLTALISGGGPVTHAEPKKPTIGTSRGAPSSASPPTTLTP
jgi:hypothetical protein